MKPIARQFRVFVAACAVTAAVWMMAWPEPAVVPQPPAKPVADVSGARWSKERIASLVAEVEAAKTDEARLHACGRLLQIPLADARETLETVNLKSGHGLSLVAKVLLIRWASGDGEAATDWAWKRFRSEGLWNDAFREIGPAWAAHKPASLAEWALRTMDNRKPGSDSITKREAEESERPLLEFGTFSKISGWLVTEDPRLAYQILIARGGM